MNLYFLDIKFQKPEDFIQEINSLHKVKKHIQKKHSAVLKFDSEKTFNKLFTINKIQILRAVSQLKPDSIYQLAFLLGREPQHVLKDCRLLESLKIITLEEINIGGRSALKPGLIYDCDIIRIFSKSFTHPFTISEKAESLFEIGKNKAVSR
ncbi:MAG: hypothetical protein Q7U04_15620 [Bacteriovorax sp.]|nr:hypothetical protein [Bacteriovorax sp.]